MKAAVEGKSMNTDNKPTSRATETTDEASSLVTYSYVFALEKTTVSVPVPGNCYEASIYHTSISPTPPVPSPSLVMVTARVDGQ
jgi:hypothetical protein